MQTMTGFVVNAEWNPRSDIYLSSAELESKAVLRGCNGWKNVTCSIRDDLPVPECGPTQVLIKVKSCGICGSDISLFEMDMDGYIHYASQCSFPVIIGHEFSGVIVAKGPSVNECNIGDYVAAEKHLWCGDCPACKRGDMNHCERLKALGFDRGYDGAMAQYVVVDQRYCYSLNTLRDIYPDDVIFDLGAMVEPLACVYEGMVNAAKGLIPGDHVAIFGAGGLGLSAIQLSRAFGAAKVIVFEPERERRNLALKMGADYVFDPFDNSFLTSDTLFDITHGQGIGMAIEASSNPERNLPLVDKAIRVGGELLCISIAAAYPRIDYMRLVRKNLTFSGAYGHAGHDNYQRIINLLEARRIDVYPAITARFTLAQAWDAIHAAASGKEGKIMIHP